MSKRFCRCGAIVQGRKLCDACSATSNNSMTRGYDRQWRKVRARVIANNPLCVDCEKEGRIRPAVEVHHIRTINEAPHLRLDLDNLVPLCEACHDRRHNQPACPG